MAHDVTEPVKIIMLDDASDVIDVVGDWYNFLFILILVIFFLMQRYYKYK